MSELEDKGYLFHPHTSAGRIPTDRAYRVYVNEIMRLAPPSREARQTLQTELPGSRNAVEEILRRAAQVLGVLTQELGVAVAPALDEVVLERLELVPVSTERLLLVFNLRSGVVRTIFVEVPGRVRAETVQEVARVLNERLAGHTLQQIRATLPERLRDAAGMDGGRELLNIFIAEAEEIFDLSDERNAVVLGSAQMLAEQPEFASNARMRELLRLTEGRDLLQAGARLAPADRRLDHDRRRESRCAPERLHAGHRVLRGRRAQGRDRRDGADPHAVRQDHRAGGAHQPPGGGICWSERVLRAARRRSATRPRTRSRRPIGSWRWSTIPTGIPRPRRRPSSRRSPRPTRSSAIPRSARRTIATARRASAAAAAASDSTTWICPKRSTSSCATSAASGGFESLFGGGRARARRAPRAGCAGDGQEQ